MLTLWQDDLPQWFEDTTLIDDIHGLRSHHRQSLFLHQDMATDLVNVLDRGLPPPQRTEAD